MTKKLPRPTASRMTRVWLPGRPRLSTACRRENERARAAGRTAHTMPLLARCSTTVTAAKPPQTISPARSDDACQPATATSARLMKTAAPACSQSIRARRAAIPAAVHHDGNTSAAAAPVPPRSSSSGRTRRTSSSGTSENSNETSTPTPTPCQTADAVNP